MGEPITLEQQIASVAREIAMRRNVYQKWVASKRMKQEQADHEIAAMEATIETLKEMKVTDALLTERNRVLKAIPGCEAHGDQCVPRALEWIEQAKLRMLAQPPFVSAGALGADELAGFTRPGQIVAVEEAPHLDSQRWRALLGCGRVRLLGYARGGPNGGEGPIRHIGFEFTDDNVTAYDPRETEMGRATLLEFVDALVKAEAVIQKPRVGIGEEGVE